LLLIALLATPARAHGGHYPAPAPAVSTAQAGNTAKQIGRAAADELRVSAVFLVSGAPYCPASGTNDACCMTAGCVAPSASVPAEAVTIPRMQIGVARPGIRPAQGIHGIQAVPATPPPRSLTIAG